MAVYNKTELKTRIDSNVTDNTSGAITGAVLNSELTNVVDSLFSTVASISALKTYDTTTLNDGDKVEVAGYYTANDGGGGLFVWDDSITSGWDDKDIIQVTGITTGGFRRKKIIFTKDYAPLIQEHSGLKTTGITDNTAINFLDITVPEGDVHYSIEITVSGQTADGGFTATTKGIISCGRKNGEANCYATYLESVAKVASDNGGGQSMSGVFVVSISPSTNIVNVSIQGDNSSSEDNLIFYYVKSIGGDQNATTKKELIFTDV